MSRYSVLSLPEADDELASIWMDGTDRERVSASAGAADRLLGDNPLHDSVHVSEQLRRRDFPPLRFYPKFVMRMALS